MLLLNWNSFYGKNKVSMGVRWGNGGEYVSYTFGAFRHIEEEKTICGSNQMASEMRKEKKGVGANL